ncbi:biotin synthase BioB [Bradyrhizobium sp. 4]|uniref:biotin synthase BioB n=1 Tax=unclassified Bradyrhizobium TaxID=2631580 RepID=UPI001FFBF92F|nr:MULTISPECIES: biotin synthase BioB [unclassified Bradyrhizobium]MCK1402297.1 biotin synthase BioB [Bradyrhizobium sp. 39]MCK1750155.1 biotin synthase BioB [Bradyrhizobium sp. 135]UPJ36398.1 biotin synthase BioB [Bradyrhizobium sp. 4]
MSGGVETVRSGRSGASAVRSDWTRVQAEALYGLPFADLMYQAQSVHREHSDPNRVEAASLLSIKTGGCPEDCSYCSQSAHYDTGLKATRLMNCADVVAKAERAKEAGATRFCMAAAWRSPKERDLDRVSAMVSAVKNLGLETCVTLGMLTAKQAVRLSESGLDFYNHNIDTSPDFYGKIITTRVLQDRIDTLEHVRRAGIKVCCGGIVGMGERVEDRLAMLVLLANLPSHPESVPINVWNEVKGVPVNHTADRPDPIALLRLIATARIMMPKSVVRLSAGRKYMTDELQALSFLAGANSIFIGDMLLTTRNANADRDMNLLNRLGITSGLARLQQSASTLDANSRLGPKCELR